MRRVVVTGMAGLCPLGDRWEKISRRLRAGEGGVELVEELGEYEGMSTRLAARVHGFQTPSTYPRRSIRSMGRVSLLATRSTELALQQAGLIDDPVLTGGAAGVSYGSTGGSPPAMEVYARVLHGERSVKGIRATDYVQMMSHTVPANLAQFFHLRGRLIPTCSACTSGSQGIGFGYEAIASGRQDVMVTGGAEEFHPIDAAVFDIMYATSTRHDEPLSTPRPFDVDRDGLVVGEGAATLVLEALDQAQARGATILAEIVGFGTNCDGKHVTNPDTEGMEGAMRLALKDADLSPDEIGYVNAHGTATPVGDVAESEATARVFGNRIPISSLKSFIGHTLGACGSIEAWLTIEMMRENWFCQTLHLDRVDLACGELDYIQDGPRELAVEYVMSNNFAFGGVNTSLIFRRWTSD
jgi:3-oxoacyl-[acyl-carrier-protein] synthase II